MTNRSYSVVHPRFPVTEHRVFWCFLVFQEVKQKLHRRFPPFCVSFLGQQTTRKCRETVCSPTFTHRLTRCFPSFQNVFLQENALFSLSECAYFRAFSTFPVWFCAENVTYSFIHWCFRSKFNIRCCTFVFLGTCHKCFKRHTILWFSPPYPSKAETSNEKLSMHFEFWILLYTATQSITCTIRVHNNIVCSTASNWLRPIHSKHSKTTIHKNACNHR